MRYPLSAAVLLVALVLPATATTASGSVAPSSGADRSSGCVTKHEYKKAHKHLRIHKVQRIFDTKGKTEFRQTGTWVKSYRFCKGSAHHAHSHRFNVMYNDYPTPIDLRRKYCGEPAPHKQPCF